MKRAQNMQVAVVRGPGGLPGIEAHIGAWLAMQAAGLHASWLSGASAGAVVSALQARGIPAVAGAAIVRDLSRGDLIDKRFAWKERIFWIDHFCDPAPLRRLLAEHLPESFSALPIRLTVATTRMERGRDRVGAASAPPSPPEGARGTFDGVAAGAQPQGGAAPVKGPSAPCGGVPGNRQDAGAQALWPLDDAGAVLWHDGGWLREVVRASTSIAGVWPYEEIRGELYSDGGTTCPFPLPPDLRAFDLVIVCNVCRRRPYKDRDRNMISRLLWNIEQLQDYQVWDTRRRLARHDNVIWLDLDIGDTSCLDFSPRHRLIEQSRLQAQSILDAAGLPPIGEAFGHPD